VRRTLRFSVAAGAVAAMATVWLLFGSRDLSVTVNGTLGGLVSIASRCVFVPPAAALVGGAISGVVFVSEVGPVDRNGTG
jgi:Amt family ammonium transporter